MPAVNKVGTQLLVSPHIRARAQALALVRQETVANIYRVALEGGGLAHMERGHRAELEALNSVLDALPEDRMTLLDQIFAQKLNMRDLFDAEGWPITKLPERLP